MQNMALALEARIRPPGQLMTKVIAGIEPAIAIEVDMDKSGENVIVATLESTGFTPSQLSALLHFIGDAIDESNKNGEIYKAYEDESGEEVVPEEVESAMRKKDAEVAKRKQQTEEPDEFDGDSPTSNL